MIFCIVFFSLKTFDLRYFIELNNATPKRERLTASIQRKNIEKKINRFGTIGWFYLIANSKSNLQFELEWSLLFSLYQKIMKRKEKNKLVSSYVNSVDIVAFCESKNLSILFLVCLFQFHWFLFSFVNDIVSHTQPNLQSVPAYENSDFARSSNWLSSGIFILKKIEPTQNVEFFSFFVVSTFYAFIGLDFGVCVPFCAYVCVSCLLYVLYNLIFFFFNLQFNAKSSLEGWITNNNLLLKEIEGTRSCLLRIWIGIKRTRDAHKWLVEGKTKRQL